MNLFLSYLVYFFVGFGLLIVGTILFALSTKTKEMQLIAQGKKAASYILGGRMLGLAIVIYAAIANSINLVDLLIWGSVAIVTQIIAFILAEWLTPKFNIAEAIDNDNQAVGVMLMFLSISIGVIIAGCLVY